MSVILSRHGPGDYQTADACWIVRRAEVENGHGRVLTSVRAWNIFRMDRHGVCAGWRVNRLSEARVWIARTLAAEAEKGGGVPS